MAWHLYMLETRNGEIYTGITTDVDRRLSEHESGRGAKSLRGKAPLKLVFQKTLGSQSDALRLEARIKKLSRVNKLAVVSGQLDVRSILDD